MPFFHGCGEGAHWDSSVTSPPSVSPRNSSATNQRPVLLQAAVVLSPWTDWNQPSELT